uniref:NACHT, LRR and PYD domains-containing protein 3-like n=1 Tax=Styela clava TaxID=7725 RepID=UPI00193ACD3C|nr:NACHT, LRR and PYD domains-containing protein 3-like [Styela clava]
MSYQKVIAKINDNTEKCTDFYDFAEPHGVFKKKLNVDVTPQLEEIDFYKGGRIPEYDYVPLSSNHQKYLEREREKGIRKQTQLDELFNNFKQGHVCFVGPAGSGKSTLMKATSRDVMHGKYFQGNIKMVPYIQCKQYMNNRKVTAGELIFNNLAQEERVQAIEIAKTHPEEVLFIIDSLDTLQYTVDGVYEVISLDEPAYPEVIMWNFLTGKLFPGCRTMSSSREHSIRNYWGEVRPDRVIALAGLTMESIKEIISGYEGEKEAEKIMEFLKIKAPLLLFLCTTPVMLVYTLIALKFQSDFKPNTMTGIMIVVMQSILRSPHTHQENILEVLGKLKELSYIGTVEHRVLFTEDDFRQVHLKPEEATDLAILAPGGIYCKLFQGIHLLYFQHQSIQEILTSFYILGLDLKSFKQFVDKHLHTGHFVLIRKMICGFLLNTTVYEAAGILLEEIQDLEEKRKVLKKSMQLQFGKISKSNKSDLMELFIALNEAKDGMIDIVKSSLDEIHMYGHPLSISDVHVIGSVASYCTSLKMDLGNCNLKSDSLQTLASGLKGSNVKIMQLWLDESTNMGVEGLSSVGQILSNQSCVEVLGLQYCNLSSDQLQAFKSSLGNTEIDKLVLDEDRTAHHKDIVAVANLLPNVTKELSLQRWKMADEDEEILQNQLNEIGSEKLQIDLDESTKLKSQRKSADATTSVFSKQLPTTTSRAKLGKLQIFFKIEWCCGMISIMALNQWYLNKFLPNWALPVSYD